MSSTEERAAVEEALARGEPREAFGQLRGVLAHPGRFEGTEELLEALGLLGRIAAALEDGPLAELLAEPKGTDVAWLYQVGYDLIERDLPLCAATVLELAAGLAPGDAEVLTELSAAFERALCFAQARDALQRAPELVATEFMPRYLLGYNALMSGDVDGLREALDGLAELEREDYHPQLTGRLQRMLARSERLQAARPLGDASLDRKDLRGWHHALTGGVLTHLSPWGFDEGMNGRYAFLQDSLANVRVGLERLALLCEEWGSAPERVYLLGERGADVLAHAAARRLELPLVAWGPEGRCEPGLIPAYDLSDLPGGTLDLLRTRRPGQLLWAHATCWTTDFPFAADVTTLLYQSNVAPWGERMRVDPETRAVETSESDERGPEALAEEVLAAEVEAEDDPADDREVLRAFAQAAGPPPSEEGPRERMWAGSPVGSNRFL
jgi:hypothetical protein